MLLAGESDSTDGFGSQLTETKYMRRSQMKKV